VPPRLRSPTPQTACRTDRLDLGAYVQGFMPALARPEVDVDESQVEGTKG
jgi:hypothetical protein